MANAISELSFFTMYTPRRGKSRKVLLGLQDYELACIGHLRGVDQMRWTAKLLEGPTSNLAIQSSAIIYCF